MQKYGTAYHVLWVSCEDLEGMTKTDERPFPESDTKPRLRDFWHDLPREGRLLLSIVVLEFLGTGLVLPFNVVYLHEVRGFALFDAGLLLGLPALVGVLVVGPGGTLIDRVGARPVQMVTLSLLVVADVVLAFASTLPVAALALVLNGVGFGCPGRRGRASSRP